MYECAYIQALPPSHSKWLFAVSWLSVATGMCVIMCVVGFGEFVTSILYAHYTYIMRIQVRNRNQYNINLM